MQLYFNPSRFALLLQLSRHMSYPCAHLHTLMDKSISQLVWLREQVTAVTLSMTHACAASRDSSLCWHGLKCSLLFPPWAWFSLQPTQHPYLVEQCICMTPSQREGFISSVLWPAANQVEANKQSLCTSVMSPKKIYYWGVTLSILEARVRH